MNLSAFYELRERLRTAAIAGTALMGDDFRLRRAVEQLAPLEQASPIFAKIGQLTRNALAPDCPDPAGALLDALSLTDAVLCTQGAVSVSQPLTPLETKGWGKAVTMAPYSLLSPLQGALENPASGTYGIVVNAHETHPELFQDYRIKAALVKTLGASYGSLANEAADWIAEDGEAAIPLLKQDFNPAGKREMARRVQVIDRIAGGQENDFYLEQIPKASKEVRPALIYALRHKEENTEKLMELVQTEKGDSKTQALWLLTGKDDPEVWAFLGDRFKKKPEQLLPHLAHASSKESGQILAQQFLEFLEPFEQDHSLKLEKQSSERLKKLLEALRGQGKDCPEIRTLYHRAARFGTRMDYPKNLNEFRHVTPMSQALPLALMYGVATAPSLESLAKELYQTYGGAYAGPLFVSMLLTQPADKVYEAFESVIASNGKSDGASEMLQNVFSSMQWDAAQERTMIRLMGSEPVYGTGISLFPIKKPLDCRWYDLLMKKRWDRFLTYMIPQNNRPVCEKLGAHFYHVALLSIDVEGLYQAMKICGWQDCKGLLSQWAKRKTRVSSWELMRHFSNLPGKEADRVAELEQTLKLLEKGHVKLYSGSLDALRTQLEELKIKLQRNGEL